MLEYVDLVIYHHEYLQRYSHDVVRSFQDEQLLFYIKRKLKHDFFYFYDISLIILLNGIPFVLDR